MTDVPTPTPTPYAAPGAPGTPKPGTPKPGRHRVVVLALPDVIPFELSIPPRIFGRAHSPSGEPLYEVVSCTPVPGRVPANGDFDIHIERGPEELEHADTVIVPAAYQPSEVYEDGRLPPGLRDVFARIRPGTRIASICTGSFFLAAAGLLDGRPATTHWWWADHFRRLFPSVRLDPDVLYVDDGDVLTSAGVAAGIDLCVHIVRRDHGAAVANDTARRSVVPPHRDGGQAQYVHRPVPDDRAHGTSAARAWALTRLHEPIRLRDLADRESMSVRTFTRRFREEVGVSPGQWLTAQRVERARQLLESTELPMDQVARDAGFGTAQSMRAHLQSALGVPPTSYRRTFRGEGVHI